MIFNLITKETKKNYLFVLIKINLFGDPFLEMLVLILQ